MIAKCIKRKVDFCELTPLLFEVLLAYAAENQVNGELKYEPEFFTDIFLWNGIKLEPGETASIMKTFQEAGLLDGFKIRSWGIFNQHLAKQAQRIKSKRLAGEISAKRRQKDAKNALKNGAETVEKGDENYFKNGEKNPQKTAQKSVQKEGGKNRTLTQELWTIDRMLETAEGPAKKALLDERRKLIERKTRAQSTKPTAPVAAEPTRPTRKKSQAELDREQLEIAQITAQDDPDMLTERMIRALAHAGKRLPPEARRNFPKLVAELEDRSNPVPG